MTENELRALVREAIARVSVPDSAGLQPCEPLHQHASHAMFIVPEGSDMGGPCLIEPAVMCNHCGYCKSMGH